jgi:hypothetical protein
VDIKKVRKTLILETEEYGSYLINEIEYVGPEYRTVRSDTAMKPDPKWHFEDRNGHRHFWNGKDVYTRLTTELWVGGEITTKVTTGFQRAVKRRETVHCDGTCGNYDCDGWSRWAWNCRQCGALIKPGYIPDYEARAGTQVPISSAYYLLSIEGDSAFLNHLGRETRIPCVLKDGVFKVSGYLEANYNSFVHYHLDGTTIDKVRFIRDDDDES